MQYLQAGAKPSSGRRRCSGNEMTTPKIYVQESKIQFVFDAVYSLAQALDQMTTDVCGHMRGKRARRRCLRSLDGQELYNNYLLNISFNGQTAFISCIRRIHLAIYRLLVYR